MMEQDPVLTELKQAIVKESIQGLYEISTLKPDFYKRVHNYLQYVAPNFQDPNAKEKWYVDPYDTFRQIVMRRRSKIIRMAEQRPIIPLEWENKLTTEEKQFYLDIRQAVLKFDGSAKI